MTEAKSSPAVLAYHASYYQKHKEAIKAKRRARYHANPEKASVIQRKYIKRRIAKIGLGKYLAERAEYEYKRYWTNPTFYRAKARASMKKTRAKRREQRHETLER